MGEKERERVMSVESQSVCAAAEPQREEGREGE